MSVTNDDYILSKGYSEELTPSYNKDHGIDRRFYKRFTDDVGKKYIISINKYLPLTHPSTGNIIDLGYEYEVYLEPKTGGALLLRFYAGAELDNVENNIEALFKTGLYNYYEMW